MNTSTHEQPSVSESGSIAEAKKGLGEHIEASIHIDSSTCSPEKGAVRQSSSPVEAARRKGHKHTHRKNRHASDPGTSPGSAAHTLDSNGSPHPSVSAKQTSNATPPPHVESSAPSSRPSRPLPPLTVEEAALVSSFPLEGGEASPVNQADFDNDARARVPYHIRRETFHVPVANHDDLPAEEAKNWAPGKPLRMAMVTWNMANHSAKIAEVSSSCIHPNAHVIVVGTQENGAYVGGNGKHNRWLQEIKETCLNGMYELVGKKHLWALNLLVFARKRDVAAHVSRVHCSHVKTGMLNGAGGNKGGVAVAIVMSMEACTDFARTTAARIEQRREMHRSAERAKNQHRNSNNKDTHDANVLSVAAPETPQERSFAQEAAVSTHSGPPGIAQQQEHSVTSPQRSFVVSNTGVGRSVADTTDVHFSSPNSPLEPHALPPSSAMNSPDHGAAGAGAAAPRRRVAPQLTFLFINAHLAAHQGAVSKRNKDYKKIVKELRVGRHGKYRSFFRKISSEPVPWQDDEMSSEEGSAAHEDAPGAADRLSEESETASRNDVTLLRLPAVSQSTAIKPYRDVTEEFDLTYFMGDLNYRINGTRQAIEYIVKEHRNIRSILVNNDQLSLERAKGKVFHNFHEGKLLFRPTYKYEVSGGVTLDQYNFSSKKNRMPAYCDRVLYKKRRGSAVGKVAIRLYTDVPAVRTSDHRPVVAIFDVETSASEEAVMQ